MGINNLRLFRAISIIRSDGNNSVAVATCNGKKNCLESLIKRSLDLFVLQRPLIIDQNCLKVHLTLTRHPCILPTKRFVLLLAVNKAVVTVSIILAYICKINIYW